VIGSCSQIRTAFAPTAQTRKEQQIEFGTVRSGEVIEVTFAFDCWLGVDQYTISLAGP